MPQSTDTKQEAGTVSNSSSTDLLEIVVEYDGPKNESKDKLIEKLCGERIGSGYDLFERTRDMSFEIPANKELVLKHRLESLNGVRMFRLA
jgi:hypothetical protein